MGHFINDVSILHGIFQGIKREREGKKNMMGVGGGDVKHLFYILTAYN